MHSGPIQIPGRPGGKYTPSVSGVKKHPPPQKPMDFWRFLCRARIPKPSHPPPRRARLPWRIQGGPAGARDACAIARARRLARGWQGPPVRAVAPTRLWLGLGAVLLGTCSHSESIFKSGAGLFTSDLLNLPKGPFILKAKVSMTSSSAT